MRPSCPCDVASFTGKPWRRTANRHRINHPIVLNISRSDFDDAQQASDATDVKTTCLINSHNYARFVIDAVDSAVMQERPFDEILVVDDGSTDCSVELLRQTYRGSSTVRLIAKPQAGQLSCFHRGVAEATGEVLFFLDADDCYHPELVATALPLYQHDPRLDFLAVGHEMFGDAMVPGDRSAPMARTRQFGCSVLAAIHYQHWIGAPTSCLSMRANLAKRILPYPVESDWMTRADDVLVFGSSLAGGCKRFLPVPLVNYRIHGTNLHAGRTLDSVDKMRYSLKVNRMIQWYIEQFGYNPERLAHQLGREFMTWQQPTFRETLSYLRMASRVGLPAHVRLEQAVVILHHYLRQRRWTPETEEGAVGVGLSEQPAIVSPSGGDGLESVDSRRAA